MVAMCICFLDYDLITSCQIVSFEELSDPGSLSEYILITSYVCEDGLVYSAVNFQF